MKLTSSVEATALKYRHFSGDRWRYPRSSVPHYKRSGYSFPSCVASETLAFAEFPAARKGEFSCLVGNSEN